ncbi:MAG: hypothetical protein A2Y95_12235 [Deltaproteobacteria bacterium RBG_13_65_10]|jgi:uncharacterized membrane protein|nr:MAG: hypothetical protein A2Y95_12235 [Deltaproteobacteria bacterium RBG_13_65_10]
MESLTEAMILTRLLPALLGGGIVVFALASTLFVPGLGRLAERLDEPRTARVALAIAIALYATWFGAASLARHWRLETETFDLGNVEQALWNTTHGDFFRMTTDPEFESNLQHGTHFPDLPDSRWAFHVEPILLAALPVYALVPRPETLLLLQTLLLAFGAIPAYAAGQAILGRRALGVACAWLYLLNPNLHRANLFDVHPLVFAAPFLLGAYALARRQRPGGAFACALAALACREDVTLAVAMLGLLWLLGRPRRLGLATLVATAIWGLVVFKGIMPAVNPQGSIFTKRLVLAGSAGELADLVRRKPGVIPWLLTQPTRLAYETYLLLPFGFLPLAGPELLALAGPNFATIVLSAHSEGPLLHGRYHYHAILLPGLLLAAATGLARLGGRAQSRQGDRVRLAGAVAMITLTVATALAWGDDAYHWPTVDNERLAVVTRAKHLIPAHAPVAASYVLGAQVAGRRDLYTLYSPNRERAAYLFLSNCERDGCDGMRKARYDAEIAAIRADPRYDLLFEERGITLLRRRP